MGKKKTRRIMEMERRDTQPKGSLDASNGSNGDQLQGSDHDEGRYLPVERQQMKMHAPMPVINNKKDKNVQGQEFECEDGRGEGSEGGSSNLLKRKKYMLKHAPSVDKRCRHGSAGAVLKGAMEEGGGDNVKGGASKAQEEKCSPQFQMPSMQHDKVCQCVEIEPPGDDHTQALFQVDRSPPIIHAECVKLVSQAVSVSAAGVNIFQLSSKGGSIEMWYQLPGLPNIKAVEKMNSFAFTVQNAGSSITGFNPTL